MSDSIEPSEHDGRRITIKHTVPTIASCPADLSRPTAFCRYLPVPLSLSHDL